MTEKRSNLFQLHKFTNVRYVWVATRWRRAWQTEARGRRRAAGSRVSKGPGYIPGQSFGSDAARERGERHPQLQSIAFTSTLYVFIVSI